MARKFSYRGKTPEELKAMTLEQFTALIPSHTRRTLKRMGMQIRKFLEKFREPNRGSKPFKTQFREMVVIPEMLDQHILVYSGNAYVDVYVIPEMLGKRIGEFAITTKLVKHSGPGIGATRGSKTVELK